MKLMKKITIIILTMLLTGCNQEETKKNIKIKENTEITTNQKNDYEYASKVYLKDLVSIKNGELVNPDEVINTEGLGQNKIEFLYKNHNDQIEKYQVQFNIVDTTIPVINVSNFSTTKGKKIDILSKTMCGDNYDRQIKCYIEGDYNFDKPGIYPLKIVAIDSNNNKNTANFKLTVNEKTSNNSSSPNYYYLEDLIKDHKNDKTMIGIDVSSWQSDINWQKVKSAGVEFAMIRIGFGQNKNGELTFDSKFQQNLLNAKANNIKVGLYFYSYAKSEEDAIKQAKWIIDNLNGEKLDLPIAFDWEIWSNFSSYNLNFNDLNKIAKAFMDEISENGYQSMLYGSAFFTNRIWNIPEYDVWLAHYTKKTDYSKPYSIWQLSSQGKVPGINGYVDLNILYKK